jgi:hypothetical protein
LLHPFVLVKQFVSTNLPIQSSSRTTLLLLSPLLWMVTNTYPTPNISPSNGTICETMLNKAGSNWEENCFQRQLGGHLHKTFPQAPMMHLILFLLLKIWYFYIFL